MKKTTILKRRYERLSPKNRMEFAAVLTTKVLDIVDGSDAQLLIDFLECLDEVEQRAIKQPARN